MEKKPVIRITAPDTCIHCGSARTIVSDWNEAKCLECGKSLRVVRTPQE